MYIRILWWGKNCINECDGYKLKEEINFTSYKKYLQSYLKGYDVDDENLLCACNKYIIGDSCSNMRSFKNNSTFIYSNYSRCRYQFFF